MLLSDVVHMPHDEAYFCPECRMIVNRATACVCGNEIGLMSMAAILDRVPQEIVEGIDPNFELKFAGHIHPLSLCLTERN